MFAELKCYVGPTHFSGDAFFGSPLCSAFYTCKATWKSGFIYSICSIPYNLWSTKTNVLLSYAPLFSAGFSTSLRRSFRARNVSSALCLFPTCSIAACSQHRASMEGQGNGGSVDLCGGKCVPHNISTGPNTEVFPSIISLMLSVPQQHSLLRGRGCTLSHAGAWAFPKLLTDKQPISNYFFSLVPILLHL